MQRPPTKIRTLRKNRANQRRQNKGKSKEYQCSLEWLEVSFALEKDWMVRQKKKH